MPSDGCLSSHTPSLLDVYPDTSATFVVQVPATSANLGPGFDALGVALTFYNRFHFTVLPSGPSCSYATGEGADSLNEGGGCLVRKAAEEVAKQIGATLPPLFVHIESHIPVTRGLGSSASAVAAGVVAADRLLNARLSSDALLSIAARMEGHADNVAPALRGGFQTAIYEENAALSLRLPVAAVCHNVLRLVVCVPEMWLSTGSARAALPAKIAHGDAAFNVGRATLLTAALCTGDLPLLSFALQDRLHQSYRQSLIPGYAEVIQAAEAAGAYGACLSGSGSTMLAFAPLAEAETVGQAMQDAFGSVGVSSRWWSLGVDDCGTQILMTPEK